MSKSSYLGANVEVTNSFGGWIDKTNQVRHDMGTIVVTVGDVVQPNTTNGAETSGNAHVEGIFSATTLSAVDALTGGTVSVPATLDITSNVDFTSTNGTIDITSSINVLTVDANNVIVSSNVTFDGGATKIFVIDAANTTVNTGVLFVNSNTHWTGSVANVHTTMLDIKANTWIDSTTIYLNASEIAINGEAPSGTMLVNTDTTFGANTLFNGALLNVTGANTTIGDSGADKLNSVAEAIFSANATFNGALVNITSANTTVGDAGTDQLNVNAVSDFNANVNIDGLFTVTNTATFTGAETYFKNNVTLGETTADTVSILGYVDTVVLPSATTVDLGSDAKPFGNVHTTYVWSDNNIDTLGDFVVRGSTARTLKALSTNTGYQTFNLVLETSTANQKLPLVANSTGIHGGANTTYDLGSTTTNWNNLYVKDAAVANSAVVSNVLTVNSQANTASLMVRDLTATRVPYVSTGGEIVDSANLTFSGSTLAVTGNTTVSANLSVTNVISAANVAATHVGAATLSTSGLATLNSLNVTGTATFNANVDLQDSDYLLIGTGDDLQLYHDGTNSYIKDAGTGALKIDASQLDIQTSNSTATETMATFVRDGAVSLYHNNTLRIATSSAGANVTGTFGVSGLATLNSANVTTTFRVNGLSELASTDFINGANVTISGDLTVLGATTLASETNISVNNSISTTATTQDLIVNGNTTLGSAASDIVTLNAKVVNDIIPNANNTYNIGSATAIYDTVYAENLVGNVAWSSVTSKPDPVVTVTLTGDVTGTGSATLTDLTSGTVSFATAIAANSVDLTTHTTGNYVAAVAAGSGLSLSGTAGEGWTPTLSHADTSSVANLAITNLNGNVLQNLSLAFDTYGHVASISAASTNLDNRYPQVTFKTFTVDDTDTEYTWAETGSAVADSLTDTLTFVGGTDIDIDVDATNDAIRIQDTSTLSTVTSRGATTGSAISITNATDSTSTTTGALKVTGGVGIAKQLRVGTNATIAGTLSATGAASFANNVTIAGDLTVNGTTTTINSTTVTYDDKNLELGSITSPSDAGADGGGITLKGTTDKTFNWIDATDAWTSSEHMNLASGKAYYIDGTSVLSSTTLGSGVTSSSLTSVGTLSTGTWSATTIAVNKGGTGQTSYTNGQLLIGNTTGNTLTKATLTAGSNITITNGTGSITIAADKTTNLGYTTATTQGTVTSSTGANATIPAANSTVAGLVTTGTQTIAGTKTFSSTISGSINGNAATATTLATARTIGGVSFDGSANIDLPGVNAAGTQNTSGNAATATTLQTTRTINGTNFNGSANITTTNWGTSRTLTIGSTGKSVSGSANVSWSLAEIGAAASSHTHTLSSLTDTTFLDLTSGDILYYTGTTWSNYTADAAGIVAKSGDQTIAGTKTFSSSIVAPGIARTGNITLDASGDIILDAQGNQIYFYDAGVQRGYFSIGTADQLTLYTGASTLNTTFAGANLTCAGDVTANSDARLKENVVTVDSALDKVSQMRGVYFNKIGEEKRSLGVIAQEIEEVLPEVVLTSADEEGTKSVAYGNIVGVLIEAIKELKAEIEELKRG